MDNVRRFNFGGGYINETDNGKYVRYDDYMQRDADALVFEARLKRAGNDIARQLKVVGWLANGETGTSSETMAFWLAFNIEKEDSGHPYDPADFDRCLRLLEAVPELRKQLPAMGTCIAVLGRSC